MLVKYKLTDQETLVLETELSYIQHDDDLAKALGIPSTPKRMYRFKNSNLSAFEEQIEPISFEDLKHIVKDGDYYYHRGE